MTRSKLLSLTVGVLAGLAVSIVVLLMPQPVHAGGVHLSIGVGIPAPVYIVPPPVIVQPTPSFAYPGVVYPPPVVYSVPYGVYGRPLPPGLAKKYHGHHHGHGYKIYKHGRHGW